MAGGFDKLKAVDFSLDVDGATRSGPACSGGFFLALSYFGTDQSQVQRYLSGASLRESRLGLMFNAVCKIPMQFFILLLGVMVFVFYQFEPPPVFFNQAAWEAALQRDPGGRPATPRAASSREAHAEKRQRRSSTGSTRGTPATPPGGARGPRAGRWPPTRGARPSAPRRRRRSSSADPRAKTNDTDYVFITFILGTCPTG